MSLFNFIKKKPKITESATKIVDNPKAEKKSKFASLRERLTKTRAKFSQGLGTLFLGKKEIDAELLQRLEEQMLVADFGFEVTQKLIENLTQKSKRKELKDSEQLLKNLQEELKAILAPVSQPLIIEEKKPYVILMVGVNGVGKTTTIGKITKQLQADNKKVMLAAGDTFRAAAIEQLQVWGERNEVPVVAQQSGADSASVIYDAMQAAKARNVDVLIADTAGRLHTQQGLMQELQKVKRVMTKLDAQAPHEILLVVDASTGQNALQQAKKFNEALELSGIVLTKLDGTAKGGIIFAIAQALKLPIRFIGVGEGIDDLRAFNADEFINAIWTQA
ncbi:MAG: signal recognition particle-docking protein FtsY [Pseudomonadota bacterium]